MHWNKRSDTRQSFWRRQTRMQSMSLHVKQRTRWIKTVECVKLAIFVRKTVSRPNGKCPMQLRRTGIGRKFSSSTRKTQYFYWVEIELITKHTYAVGYLWRKQLIFLVWCQYHQSLWFGGATGFKLRRKIWEPMMFWLWISDFFLSFFYLHEILILTCALSSG